MYMPYMPGIGLIKRRLETEEQAVALATSHILKTYDIKGETKNIVTLETKYHGESGDWYVALGWGTDENNDQDGTKNYNDDKGAGTHYAKRAVIRMDSILGTVTDTQEL